MKIVDIKTIHGPNLYHSSPIIVMRLDLGKLVDTASTDIAGFTQRLTNCFGGLVEHTCSPGHRGGFIQRLERGTYPAHIVEHIALELSSIVGIGVSFGKSVFESEPGRYKVITTFRNEQGMKFCLESAVEAFLTIAEGKKFDIETWKLLAREKILEGSLGPSGQALWDAAQARGIPVRRIGEASLLELGWGIKRKRVQAAVSDRTSLIATELVQDKALTKSLLKDAFIPVPYGRTARTEEEFKAVLQDVPRPWAIKPMDGHHGQGVKLQIETETEALKAFYEAREFCPMVLIEQMIEGRDYRLFVVNGRLVAASERTPAHVIGDGVLSVRALIEKENADPRRGDGHMSTLTKLPINSSALECLRAQGFDWDAVPGKGVRVELCRTANLSTGGTAKDVTDEVHTEIRDLAERVAKVVDLDICGIDLIHPDIRKGLCDSTAVIEVNAGPGLRMHLAPTEGKARDVGDAIIASLFPNGDNGKIPIVSVTGTNGKTTVARLLAHTISQTGKVVGHTTSNGIYIDGRQVAKGDLTGPLSAQAVLHDTRVEFAVLETARGGIMRGGLGYTESDVAIITNIRPDHIGQDGIESLDDIVHVKALVAEQVREGGTLILNADDEKTSQLAERPRVRAERKVVCYYSVDENNPLIEKARGLDHCCYFLSRGWLVESKGDVETRVVAVDELPMTFGGTSDYQISNALAVLAAARAVGIDLEQIKVALKSFAPQIQNLGRGSLYKIGEGHLFLDYGHNPDAIAAVAETIRRWRPRKLVGVVGLPGDRSDELLRASIKVAASMFDQLVFRDDNDRRGRAVGEVPLMALQTAELTNHRCEASIVLDEDKAIGHVIENLRPGDVAVVFYDELESALEVLRRYDPIPVLNLPNFQEMIEEKEISDAFSTTIAFSS